MKKFTAFLLMVFLCFYANAQGTPPNLIISELFGGLSPRYAYAEITNIGSDTVHLNEIYIGMITNAGANFHRNAQTNHMYRLDDERFERRMPGNVLAPGQSAVIVNNLLALDAFGDTIQLVPDFYWEKADIIDIPTFGEGSATFLRWWGGDDATFLAWDANGNGQWDWGQGVDMVLDVLGTSNDYGGYREIYNIAGVTEAALNHVMIRKANVAKGNEGDFTATKGVSAEDSEWIVLPWDPRRTRRMFSTAGYHGADFTFDVSTTEGEFGENSGTVPWGTSRDAIYNILELGPNLAWGLIWGPDTLMSTLVQTNDTLVLNLVGNTVETRKFHLTQAAPAANMNRLYPRVETVITQGPRIFPEFAPVLRPILVSRYDITRTDGVDTVGMAQGMVPYATRLDTLLKYTETAPNASIRLVNGNRAHLMEGDKLEVTAQDGSIREYYIKVADKVKSDNVFLSNIFLGGQPLEGFKRRIGNYYQVLDPGTVAIPDISVIQENKNSVVTIERPVSLRGSINDRTARIHVVSESGLFSKTYSIEFKTSWMEQPNRMDPILSEVFMGENWHNAIEIANIGNVPIDLSDYVIAAGVPAVGAAALLADTTFEFKIRLGYKLDRTRSATGIFYEEVSTPYSTILDPGRAFVLSNSSQAFKSSANTFEQIDEFADVYTWDNNINEEFNVFLNPFGDGWNMIAWTRFHRSASIWRITNDDVFDGIKSGHSLEDHKLVDLWGGIGATNNRTYEGVVYPERPNLSFIRKPDIHFGNTANFGSYGTTSGTGEFIIDGDRGQQTYHKIDLGNHAFTPPMHHSSTVSSHLYLVSDGWGLSESIGAVRPGTTAETFMGNIIRHHNNQVLDLVSGQGTGTLASDALIQAGDSLKVTSSNGENQTFYLLSIGTPDNNALLTSTVYTIAVDGSTGSISGIPGLTTLEDVVGNVTVPASVSLFSIFDTNHQLVPLESFVPDSLIVSFEPPFRPFPVKSVPVVASDEIYFEVVAEDGETKILYNLVIDDSAPYLVSQMYDVVQEKRVINNFTNGTSLGAFLRNVTASKGAEIRVYDKLGYEKADPLGLVYLDDKVVVSNASASVSYMFNLTGEDMLSNNSSLSNLVVSVGTLSPVFDPVALGYSVVVPANTTSLMITATKADPLSEVEGDGVISLLGDTTVSIVVTAENGTHTTYEVSVSIATSIAEFNAHSVNIYPNPVNSELIINMGNYAEGVHVTVANITGSVVYSRRESAGPVIRVDTQGFEPGLYFVTINRGDTVVTKKIVKQ